MRYLLDTNTCIRYLNGRAPAVRTHLAAAPLVDVAVCAPVKAELYYWSIPLTNGHLLPQERRHVGQATLVTAQALWTGIKGMTH